MSSELTYIETQEFKRGLKRLAKRFPSLPGDLETLKIYVIEAYFRTGGGTPYLIPIAEAALPPNLASYKIKRFACRSLKGLGSRSGLRLTLIYNKVFHTVTLVELYFKADQENENRSLLRTYLRSISQE